MPFHLFPTMEKVPQGFNIQETSYRQTIIYFYLRAYTVYQFASTTRGNEFLQECSFVRFLARQRPPPPPGARAPPPPQFSKPQPPPPPPGGAPPFKGVPPPRGPLPPNTFNLPPSTRGDNASKKDFFFFFFWAGPPPPPPSGPGPPHTRGFYITHNDASQSVGLLWASDQLVAETST